MTATYEQLVSILTALHEAPTDHFRPEATYADLDVDSLTMVEISIHIERHLGITVDDSELVPELTLGATADLIDARRSA
ncbi:acyl carrier protein [Streptomyces bacillaris]|uniref:acyl carrier protein n=1 Tax=Streptomyces TaxID=1883 RepID=UPI000A091B69|nr:acyl carrier protein [Streptomyces sp. S8]ARI50990.1 acyl carrier protein [Streptomyces sp. S8]